jgi:hypothetical protein
MNEFRHISKNSAILLLNQLLALIFVPLESILFQHNPASADGLNDGL